MPPDDEGNDGLGLDPVAGLVVGVLADVGAQVVDARSGRRVERLLGLAPLERALQSPRIGDLVGIGILRRDALPRPAAARLARGGRRALLPVAERKASDGVVGRRDAPLHALRIELRARRHGLPVEVRDLRRDVIVVAQRRGVVRRARVRALVSDEPAEPDRHARHEIRVAVAIFVQQVEPRVNRRLLRVVELDLRVVGIEPRQPLRHLDGPLQDLPGNDSGPAPAQGIAPLDGLRQPRTDVNLDNIVVGVRRDRMLAHVSTRLKRPIEHRIDADLRRTVINERPSLLWNHDLLHHEP